MVILLFSGVLVSAVCVCAVLLLLCPLYNPVGVLLLSSLCVGSLCSLWSFTGFCAMEIFFVAEGRYCRRSVFVTVFHYNDIVLSYGSSSPLCLYKL